MENQNKQGEKNYEQAPMQQNFIVINQNKKSVGLAIVLSLFFGPLGLLYASVLGGVVMFIISVIVAIFTLGFGLIITNIICVIWAVISVNNVNHKPTNVIHSTK